jgi:hypothetical protein
MKNILDRTSTFRNNPFTRKIYSKRKRRAFKQAKQWHDNYTNYWKKYNKISQQALGKTEK